MSMLLYDQSTLTLTWEDQSSQWLRWSICALILFLLEAWCVNLFTHTLFNCISLCNSKRHRWTITSRLLWELWNKFKGIQRCVRTLIFSIFSLFLVLEILHMVNMPAYNITLTLLFLKFFLQSKDNLFLSTIIQFSRIRVYAQVSVWVCAWDCPGMQMYIVQP